MNVCYYMQFPKGDCLNKKLPKKQSSLPGTGEAKNLLTSSARCHLQVDPQFQNQVCSSSANVYNNNNKGSGKQRKTSWQEY